VCEILPFGYQSTLEHIRKLGFKGHLRLDHKKSPVVTDNGAYLFDIELDSPIDNPQKIHSSLKSLTGVLETGLFFHIVNKILVGLKEGEVIIYE